MKIHKSLLEMWSKMPHEVAVGQSGQDEWDELKARNKAYAAWKQRGYDPTETGLYAITSTAKDLWRETYRYKKSAR